MDMESKKQAAVEWFNQEVLDLLIKLEREEISNIDYIKAYNKIFNQAKEMERQQIRIAYSSKCTNESCDYSKKVCSCGLNYYNETFKQ